MTPFHIRRKLKQTIKGTMLGATCCSVIYATVILQAAKSILKMQTTRVDL